MFVSRSRLTVVVRLLRSSPSTLALPSSVVPNSGVPVTCWSKTLMADWYGGVTKRLMFSTTNTTRVCVSSGSVQKVSVVQAFQDVSALGWHPDGVTKSTLDVNWCCRSAPGSS